MYRYALRRIGYMLLALLGATAAVFFLLRMVPGDVVAQMVDLQSQSDPGQAEELRRFFGLDQPWYWQFLTWLRSVLGGDLGHSWRLGETVATLLLGHLGRTLELALLAAVFSGLVGIPVGIWSAVRRDRLADGIIRLVSLAGLSVPVFWQGSMLILIFSLYLRWTPPLHWVSPTEDLLGHISLIALPVVTLGTASAAVVVRMTRNSLLDVLHQDYVRTARAKGAAEKVVLFRHALKNALIPVITVIGLQMGYLFGGVVVVEEVFALPGVGRLLLQGLTQRDYPLVQGAVLCIAILFMLVNLLTDLAYGSLDPRIRYT